MTDAPKIDMQAPDTIWDEVFKRDGENVLTIAGDYPLSDTGSVEFIRADLSAAREAAAVMQMREDAANEACYACGSQDSIRILPLPDTTALDRQIAERVREAVEAEREACRQIVQSVINDPRTKFWGDLAEARSRIAARGSKEGRDASTKAD